MGIMEVGVSRDTLTEYKKIKYIDGTYLFEEAKLNFGHILLPKKYWEEVNQLHFGGDIKDFLKRYGGLRKESLSNSQIKVNGGVFGGRVGIAHAEIQIVLEWYNKMVMLWINTIERGTRFAREKLSDKEDSEPWQAEIPSNGFKPFLSIFHPPPIKKNDGFVYALPENDDYFSRLVLRFVAEEFSRFIQDIPIIPYFKEKSITPIWLYQPRDWIEAAVACFYIDQISAHRRCECGCGLPVINPRSRFYDKKHAERHKKRIQRDKEKDPTICPICKEPPKTEPGRRRVGQIIRKLK